MAMSAEHRSKFAAIHRQWWHLDMSEKFSSGTINSKQTNNTSDQDVCLDNVTGNIRRNNCYLYYYISHVQKHVCVSLPQL